MNKFIYWWNITAVYVISQKYGSVNMKEAGKSMVPIFPRRISDSVLNHGLICLAWLSKVPKALNKPAQAWTAPSRSPETLTFPYPQLLFLVLPYPLSRQHKQFYLLLSNVSAGSAAKNSLVPAKEDGKSKGAWRCWDHQAVPEEIASTHGPKPLHLPVTIFSTCLTLWIQRGLFHTAF